MLDVKDVIDYGPRYLDILISDGNKIRIDNWNNPELPKNSTDWEDGCLVCTFYRYSKQKSSNDQVCFVKVEEYATNLKNGVYNPYFELKEDDTKLFSWEEFVNEYKDSSLLQMHRYNTADFEIFDEIENEGWQYIEVPFRVNRPVWGDIHRAGYVCVDVTNKGRVEITFNDRIHKQTEDIEFDIEEVSEINRGLMLIDACDKFGIDTYKLIERYKNYLKMENEIKSKEI